MANTYSLIASTVLSSTSPSVSFSAIPALYDDLVLKVSASIGTAGWDAYVSFNDIGGTSYTTTTMYGTATTLNLAKGSSFGIYFNSALRNSANYFSNIDVYIPSYRSISNKSIFGMASNMTPSGVDLFTNYAAALFTNTSAINKVSISPNSGDFIAGSTFSLYGILKS